MYESNTFGGSEKNTSADKIAMVEGSKPIETERRLAYHFISGGARLRQVEHVRRASRHASPSRQLTPGGWLAGRPLAIYARPRGVAADRGGELSVLGRAQSDPDGLLAYVAHAFGSF